ncbi:MAG: TetR/AcrR family transcriptional regulator [Candidatus Methanomethylophilaceae archaeon]|nr:TetR/AcrR family transcriptional regulator [Candidatus Methanomethylophilaceae archaeon]
MGIYEAARNRTLMTIQESFWELYILQEKKRVTIGDICKNAGITRSTFYYYYKDIDEVLDSIKQKQMDLIHELFDTSNNENRDFQSFIPRFQKLFLENERYLVPLVMEYRDPDFSLRYRSYIEDRMLNDLQITVEEPSTQTAETLSIIISGLVHMFLNCLASNIITLEDANNMSNGMINTGLRWILKEKYGATIGFKKMVN